MTAVHVPSRTVQQRMEALERANDIRVWRSRQKRLMKVGRKSVFDLLNSDDERLTTMRVIDLLLATPKIGRTKANKILARGGISPSKTLGGMTARQRQCLERALAPYGERS